MSQRIKDALAMTMKEFGISQTQLASRSDVKQPHISDYLNPKKNKRFEDETLEKLIAALPSDARIFFLFQLATPTERDVPAIMRSLAKLMESDQAKVEVSKETPDSTGTLISVK